MSQNGGKFEHFTLQEITLVSNCKPYDIIFRGGSRSNVHFSLENNNVEFWGTGVIHYTKKISPQSAIVKALQQEA